MSELANLKVVDDSTIIDMLKKQEFKDAFAFLASAAEQVVTNKSEGKKKGCSCKSKGTIYSNVDFNKLKERIAQMTFDQRTTMKTLLNAKKVRVIYRSGTGKRIGVTF